MATVQWRPEVNALTTPQSYRPRYIPRNIVGYEELAAEIVQGHPTYNEDLVGTVMESLVERIKEHLINGDQVTLTNAFTFRLSLSARMNAPDETLPPVEDILRVRVAASRPFVRDVQQEARLERLPASEKLPLITAAEDTVLGLKDVLNPAGALRLTGNHLFFDHEHEGGECMLEGTRSGNTAQSRFVRISNTEITFLPDIPDQPDPWNNEYRLSVSTRYTERGTLRTGMYRRLLRIPLNVVPGMDTGILTGRANSPYVTVTDGTLAADEMVRIQVVLDLHEGDVLFSLLGMDEEGPEGEAVRVTADGPYTLPGFAGSGLSSLNLTVNNFTRLVEMIRNSYSGRLVDVLDLTQGS